MFPQTEASGIERNSMRDTYFVFNKNGNMDGTTCRKMIYPAGTQRRFNIQTTFKQCVCWADISYTHHVFFIGADEINNVPGMWISSAYGIKSLIISLFVFNCFFDCFLKTSVWCCFPRFFPFFILVDFKKMFSFLMNLRA